MALLIVALAALGLPVRSSDRSEPVGAQDVALSQQIVGSWTVLISADAGPNNTTPLVVMFGADRTLAASDGTGRAGFGTWIPTGDQLVEFRFITVLSGVNGGFAGTQEWVGRASLDPSAQTWTGDIVRNDYALDGSVSSLVFPLAPGAQSLVQAVRITLTPSAVNDE